MNNPFAVEKRVYQSPGDISNGGLFVRLKKSHFTISELTCTSLYLSEPIPIQDGNPKYPLQPSDLLSYLSLSFFFFFFKNKKLQSPYSRGKINVSTQYQIIIMLRFFGAINFFFFNPVYRLYTSFRL